MSSIPTTPGHDSSLSESSGYVNGRALAGGPAGALRDPSVPADGDVRVWVAKETVIGM